MLHVCTGEQIVLLFGVVESHEDDTQRAAGAAIELQARVRDLAGERRVNPGTEMLLHTGISTGLVLRAIA